MLLSKSSRYTVDVGLLGLFFFCLMDIKLGGLRLSQFYLIFFCFISINRKLDLSVFKKSLYRFYIGYIILFILAIDFDSVHISFLIMNCLTIVFVFFFYTYLKDSGKETVLNTVHLFILINVALILMDIVLMKLGIGIFKIFATNPVEGYKSHQLYSNEPNWLSSFLLLLNIFRRQIKGTRAIDKYDIGVIFMILVLSSRIALLLLMIYYLRVFWNKKYAVHFIAASVLGAATFMILIATSPGFLRDIVDLNKNPRLNDFLTIFLNNEFSLRSLFVGFGPGALLELTEVITWREPSFVLNVVLTQFYFEYGLLGIFIFIFVLLRNFKYRIVAIVLLLNIIFHNSFFKPQFWVIFALLPPLKVTTDWRKEQNKVSEPTKSIV